LATQKKAPRRASPRKRTRQTTKHPLRWLALSLAITLITGLLYYRLDPSSSPPPAPAHPPRPISNTTELQIALAREGYSPGSIDGLNGEQTRLALLAYQTTRGLPLTGNFNADTAAGLQIQDPVFAKLLLSERDFQQIGPKPASWRARGKLDRMRYNSLLEMVAEQTQCDPDFIIQLNPDLPWGLLKAGDMVLVPRIPRFRIAEAAAHIRIQLSARTLRVYSADNRLLFHCPVSIARRVDKRPSGELRVKVRVAEPNYTFNPAILVGTAQREGITQKFVIQPGPNNPVGSVWIGLNLPSYGMHGTPEPEQVGRTESSGCFRLANWNAQTLLQAVRVDMPVYVDP
jgi:lipoprotein-anchoring transpeptidase ErfK/SrfK